VRAALRMPRASGSTKHRPLPAAPTSFDGREVEVGLPYLMGALHHAVQHEFACTLGDLLIRRTHVAYETRDNGRAAARRVVESVAPLLQWDAAARSRELTRYDTEVERIFRIDP
jgi:glycerol-3-phosphate dehydrogenase